MRNIVRPVRTFVLSVIAAFVALAIVFVISVLAAYVGSPVSSAPSTGLIPSKGTAKKTLRAFGSEAELRNYFRQLAEERKRAMERAREGGGNGQGAPAASQAAGYSDGASVAKTAESVTNTQHAGVDEGGIVKLHGDHLVVLRRGRLFTVAVGGGALKPISVVDAFGPDIDPRSTWYDEMLVSDDTVAVIGYSYERGGTEVGLFNINRSGNLSYRSTYHLRSNDYYSSRNYASRLIGSKLIFYTPLYLSPYGDDPFAGFPAVRKWHKGGTAHGDGM